MEVGSWHESIVRHLPHDVPHELSPDACAECWSRCTDGRVAKVKGDPDNPDSRGFLCIARARLPRDHRQSQPPASSRSCATVAATRRGVRPAGTRRSIASRARCGRSGPPRSDSGRGTAWLREQLWHANRVVPHTPLRQSHGAQWWSAHDDLLGPRRVRTRSHGRRSRPARRKTWARTASSSSCGPPTSRASPTPRATSPRHARAARTSSRSTSARPEAAAQSDEVIVLRPGTDAALALAMMHVIIDEARFDRRFVARLHGRASTARGARQTHSPAWAAAITGIAAERIVASRAPLRGDEASDDRPWRQLDVQGRERLARRPAPSAVCRRSPAISAYPAGVSGRATAAPSHGQALNSDLLAIERRPPAATFRTRCRASPRPCWTGGCALMLLLGTNMLSFVRGCGRPSRRDSRAQDLRRQLRPLPERHRDAASRT